MEFIIIYQNSQTEKKRKKKRKNVIAIKERWKVKFSSLLTVHDLGGRGKTVSYYCVRLILTVVANLLLSLLFKESLQKKHICIYILQPDYHIPQFL